MTRPVRFVLLAAACQALLGLAVVATGPPSATTRRPADSARLSAGAVPHASVPSSAEAVPAGNASAFPRIGAPQAVVGHRATTTTHPGASSTATATTAVAGTTARTSATTTTTTAGPSGPRCPDPKTCDIYKVIGPAQGGPQAGTKGWRPGAEGIVRIPFFVNPAPPVGSGLTEAIMEAAFLEATRIIEAANPRLDYVYQGRTTRAQNQYDGVNVFTWGNTALHRFDRDGYIVESDVGPSHGAVPGDFAYTPCEQRDGSCTSTGGKSEILSLIMHEVMHTTGLADLSGPEVEELTMFPGNLSGGRRQHITLGLGDVLGLRHLYPTSAPMPPIYAP